MSGRMLPGKLMLRPWCRVPTWDRGSVLERPAGVLLLGNWPCDWALLSAGLSFLGYKKGWK